MWYFAYFFIICFCLEQTATAKPRSRKGFVAVPVMDLVGTPFPSVDDYRHLPLCWGAQNRDLACPRVHQLLLHEPVEILDTNPTGDQYMVAITQAYRTDRTTQTQHATYWAPKHQIVTFDQLNAHGIPLFTIPKALDFRGKKIPTRNIVTLKEPFHDPITGLTFSAGTRFVRRMHHNVPDGYSVYAFDLKNFGTKIVTLPQDLCCPPISDNRQQMRRNFVQLIRSWAHNNKGFIPYGWGCGSLTHYTQGTFQEVTTHRNGIPISYFVIDGYPKNPCTGFDCSSLVARAAQMVGIPYFCKNTITIEKSLAPLRYGEPLEEGDLILIPGHVMIVASLKKNTLFEARHFLHGYGKVQEIPISEQFSGIATYDDLVTAHFEQQPIDRLDISGTVREKIPRIKLFKLESVWS